MKRAAIVGSDGQDGKLLRDALLAKGYDVHGISRKGPVDISSAASVAAFVKRYRPHEIYFLAAHHHSSEQDPGGEAELFRKSAEVNLLALVHFLEAIRTHSKRSRLFYAASSRIFGRPSSRVQSESTPLEPDDAYGIAKAAGVMTCRYYRRRHGVFASVGILYNHESPLRGPGFVSRKIVTGLLDVKRGGRRKLVLGDLAAEADWGYAPDYVEAMRRILGLARPDDFVIASGRKHSVLDFVKVVCKRLGLDWRKCVVESRGLVGRGKKALVGDPAKLKRATGWRPSVDFEGMVDALLRAESQR